MTFRPSTPRRSFRIGFVQMLAVASLALPAFAQSDADLAREDRIRELERKVEVLAEELEKTQAESAVPDDLPLTSSYGLGPAASKVYKVGRGLSIGGYGEGFYRKFVSEDDDAQDNADFLRWVMYLGYKFSDRIIFNSEVELEHGTTSSTESSGNGSFSVEFAQLDFLLTDAVNLRAGMLLVPLGFVNEIHEPPFFYGVNRPEVERQIIPSTFRENGAGVFGSFFDDMVQYRAYILNGLNAEGFSSSNFRGGRQKGNRALAEHLSFAGRVDVFPWEGVQLGASVFVGETGQNSRLDTNADDTADSFLPDARLTMWEAHADWRAYGLHARALVTGTHLKDARDLTLVLRGSGDIGANESIARETIGVYGELGWDIMPFFHPDTSMMLEPFFRYEYIDTQHDVPSGLARNDAKKIEIHTVGLSFKPIPQVVIKADYRSRDAKGGATLADEFNLGIGYAF